MLRAASSVIRRSSMYSPMEMVQCLRAPSLARATPDIMRVSWPVEIARTRASFEAGFRRAGRRAKGVRFRRSVLAETISQESTKLRIIITIHAVQARKRTKLAAW